MFCDSVDVNALSSSTSPSVCSPTKLRLKALEAIEARSTLSAFMTAEGLSGAISSASLSQCFLSWPILLFTSTKICTMANLFSARDLQEDVHYDYYDDRAVGCLYLLFPQFTCAIV